MIADRMERLRASAGVEPKDVAAVVFPNQTPGGDGNAVRSWYKRTTSRQQDFSLGELERALDYLIPLAHRRGTIAAPDLPGFPLLDIEAAVRAWRGD